MIKIVFFTIFLFLSSLAHGQPINKEANKELHGFIYEHNYFQKPDTNKPIQNVQIIADFANPTNSDQKGEFWETFDSIPPGGELKLSLGYKNWEVVNESDLHTKLPDNPQKQVLNLYMCQPELLSKNRMDYYNVSKDQIIKKYDEKIKQLNKQSQNYEKLVKKLTDVRDSLLAQAYNMADGIARWNFAEITDIQNRAFMEFQSGNIDSALHIMESVDSKKIIADAKLAINKQIKFCMFSAKLYTLNFQFDKAEVEYETAISGDTTNFNNVFEYANYLTNMDQIDKAILWYEKAMKITNSEFKSALVIRKLGHLYICNNNYAAAEDAYKKALHIFEHLTEFNSKSYRFYVASTLTYLGLMYRGLNNYAAAEDAYKRSLKINEPITIGNYTLRNLFHYPDAALTLYSVGNLYIDNNNYPEAEKALKRALRIYESLAKNEDQFYNSKVAMTLISLGILYRKENDYLAAKDTTIRALKIYEGFAVNNPQSYESSVARTLNHLGQIYRDEMSYSKADSVYKKALEINERLAANNPLAYEPSVAFTLNNLGTLYLDRKDSVAAERAYKKSLEIYKRLAETNPQTYEPRVASLQNCLGLFYYEYYNYPKAEQAHKRALKIYERLVKTNQQIYEPDYALTLSNLGNVYFEAKDFPAGFDTTEKALQIYERLAETNPMVYEPDLALTLFNLGNYYFDIVDYPKAKNAYERSLEIYRRFAQISPEVYEPKVASVLNNFAGLFIRINDYSAAEEAARKVLEISKKVHSRVKDETTAVQLANAYGQLSYVLLYEKNFYAAEVLAMAGINIPGFRGTFSFDINIEWIYTNLAASLLFQGKINDAERIYKHFINKPYSEGKTWNEVFLEDLDKLEEAGITHPDVKIIRDLLAK